MSALDNSPPPPASAPAPQRSTEQEEELERLAVEELLREAVQGAARAELIGPSGWVKNSHPKPNKKFLCNTIRHAVASNRYHQEKSDRRRLSRRSPRRDRTPEPYFRRDKYRSK